MVSIEMTWEPTSDDHRQRFSNPAWIKDVKNKIREYVWDICEPEQQFDLFEELLK